MTIAELREKSTDIANKARAVLDTITDENRSEKEAEFDRMMVDSDDLATRAERMERAEARSKAFAEIDTQTETETRTSDNGEAERRAAIDSYLRKQIDSHELRAAGVGVNADGGFTVDDSVSAKVIETMKFTGPMLSGLADEIVTTNGNSIKWPCNDDTGNAGVLIDENSAAAADDLAFTQKNLGVFKITSKVFRVSNELLADSSVDIEAFITKKIGERIGRGMHGYVTTGSGSSQPEGLVTGASNSDIVAAVDGLTQNNLIDVQAALDHAYASNAVWQMSQKTRAAVRKLTSTDGYSIWQPAMAAGEPETLLGKPLYINNDMAEIGASSRSIVYGDMKKYLVRRVGNVSIKRLDELYATSDQSAFVAFYRFGGLVTDASGIVYMGHAAS